MMTNYMIIVYSCHTTSYGVVIVDCTMGTVFSTNMLLASFGIHCIESGAPVRGLDYLFFIHLGFFSQFFSLNSLFIVTHFKFKGFFMNSYFGEGLMMILEIRLKYDFLIFSMNISAFLIFLRLEFLFGVNFLLFCRKRNSVLQLSFKELLTGKL